MIPQRIAFRVYPPGPHAAVDEFMYAPARGDDGDLLSVEGLSHPREHEVAGGRVVRGTVFAAGVGRPTVSHDTLFTRGDDGGFYAVPVWAAVFTHTKDPRT